MKVAILHSLRPPEANLSLPDDLPFADFPVLSGYSVDFEKPLCYKLSVFQTIQRECRDSNQVHLQVPS